MDTLAKSIDKARRRHVRRRKQLSKVGYPATTEGQAVCEAALPTLLEFLRGPDRPQPPKGLEHVVRQFERPEIGLTKLAAVALSSVMHFVAADESEPKDKPREVRIAMGRALHRQCWESDLLISEKTLHRRIRKAKNLRRARWLAEKAGYREDEWSQTQLVRAGHWLLACCLRGLPKVIGAKRRGFGSERLDVPFIHDRAIELYEIVKPAFLPSTEPLHPWTDWSVGGYWNEATPISTTFVRDCNPDTKAAVRAAFSDVSMQQHVNAVNALQAVGWTINTAMIEVVKQFAGEKVTRKDIVRRRGGVDFVGGVGKRSNRFRVAEDIRTATRDLVDKTFYVPHNVDFRGRVYGIPDFNFQREDYVRSLFLFADGMKITSDGIELLMIHVANCGDFEDPNGRRISKRPWQERINWAKSNRDLIEKIARDPVGTVDQWRDADAPFSFVAGCIELAAAWNNPNYVTRLPICFDGSCSGIQHLCMMAADEKAGALVNLIDSPEPQDVYQVIRKRVVELAKEAGDDPDLKWWLDKGDRGITRKIVKRPAMTFAYSVSVKGMARHIKEAYEESNPNDKPPYKAVWRLAELIMRASKEVLVKPDEAMRFIKSLARHRAERHLPFTWKTPTGFPWHNTYWVPKTEQVPLYLEGVRFRTEVADGYEPRIRLDKSLNAAAPNFVHAMDACHLIRVVNAAASEGITNLVGVHDSFGCPAPQAARFRAIIGKELVLLYVTTNVLRTLQNAADLQDAHLETGRLDLMAVQHCEYSFA